MSSPLPPVPGFYPGQLRLVSLWPSMNRREVAPHQLLVMGQADQSKHFWVFLEMRVGM